MQVKVTSDMEFLRVRSGAGTAAPVVGYVANGATLEIDHEHPLKDAKGRNWYPVTLPVYSSVMYGDEALTKVWYGSVSGYVAGWLLDIDQAEPEPEQPSPSNKPLLGVNVIFNGDDARNAVASGCKFVSVTFNPDLAWELKQQHPELMIAARGNFNKGALPGDAHFLDKVGPAIHPGMIIYGINENDHGVEDDTPEKIKKRAEFDAKWWKYCADRGATYAGAGYAMGCPNVMRKDIRDALKQYYAPLVNAGMWFNQHTYSGNDHSGIPLKERIFKADTWPETIDGITFTMRQTWWLEERWRFYCALCGFDPSKFKFISDETGADDNPGGFLDNGYSDEEVVAWGRRYIQITSEPVLHNGKFYPSNFVGGALFQAGDDAKWAGYEVRRYFKALQVAGWAA